MARLFDGVRPPSSGGHPSADIPVRTRAVHPGCQRGTEPIAGVDTDDAMRSTFGYASRALGSATPASKAFNALLATWQRQRAQRRTKQQEWPVSAYLAPDPATGGASLLQRLRNEGPRDDARRADRRRPGRHWNNCPAATTGTRCTAT